MASAAAKSVHVALYFFLSEEVTKLLQEPKHYVHDEAKYGVYIDKSLAKIVEAFDRATATLAPKREVELHRSQVSVHKREVRATLARANAFAEARRVARAQGAALRKLNNEIERGRAAGTVETLLEVRSRKFERKAVEAKTRRGLRGEKRAYVAAVFAKHLVGTKAHSVLLSDLAAPFLADLRKKVGGDLATAEQHLARGEDGVAVAVEESLQASLSAFLRVAADWGLATPPPASHSSKGAPVASAAAAAAAATFSRVGCGGAGVGSVGVGSGDGGSSATAATAAAADFFTREARVAAGAVEAQNAHLLARALETRHVTAAAAAVREEIELKAQRLVVDNDYALYRIPPPRKHPDKDFKPTRAEMETGHFLTVYSAVTIPEQHAAPIVATGRRPHRRGVGSAVRGAPFNDEVSEQGPLRRGRQDSRVKMAAVQDGDLGAERHGFAATTGLDKFALMRHESCLAPYAGKRVVVHGVRGRADLNAQVGDCVAFCELTGRYVVQLDSGRRLKLLPVKLCGHCDDPRDGPCVVCALMPES